MKLFNDQRDWIWNERFGLFVHWGIYALGEWHEQELWRSKITRQEYEQRIKEFNPVNFNPDEWIKHARQAGMTHLCFTAKHHDGFCLFDSQLTDYKSTNTRAKRDLVREYVEAFRAEGHGISKPQNQETLYLRLCDFLAGAFSD